MVMVVVVACRCCCFGDGFVVVKISTVLGGHVDFLRSIVQSEFAVFRESEQFRVKLSELVIHEKEKWGNRLMDDGSRNVKHLLHKSGDDHLKETFNVCVDLDDRCNEFRSIGKEMFLATSKELRSIGDGTGGVYMIESDIQLFQSVGDADNLLLFERHFKLLRKSIEKLVVLCIEYNRVSRGRTRSRGRRFGEIDFG